MRTHRRKQDGCGPALRESSVSRLVLSPSPTRLRFRWLWRSGRSLDHPECSPSWFAWRSGGIVPCFPRASPFCIVLSILRRFQSVRLVHVGGRRALSVWSVLPGVVDLGPVSSGAPGSRWWPARLHPSDRLAAALPRGCFSPSRFRPGPSRFPSSFESRARRYFSTFTRRCSG